MLRGDVVSRWHARRWTECSLVLTGQCLLDRLRIDTVTSLFGFGCWETSFCTFICHFGDFLTNLIIDRLRAR